MTITSTAAEAARQGAAGILADLQFRARPGLYVTPAVTHAGCLLVIDSDSDGPYAHGQVVGLAIPAPGGGWRLGCTRCHAPVSEGTSPRGLCAPCSGGRG